ncbi:MAG: phosphate/phosphite/phosphonate ABC transporter substrate-binding protein [Desulfobacterales bacterium]|nr:phosphate/phosphite/phosphonate ABC transporter substrate-binding protein [Desulfobacterales bacterium]
MTKLTWKIILLPVDLIKFVPKFTVLACCVLIFVSSPVLAKSSTESKAADPDKTTIYFYSSESNITDFTSLKIEFDTYLSKFGKYEFQPFKKREDFEKSIKDKHNCLVIMSGWHYRNIRKNYSLKPVFMGTRNGKKYQKRILVATNKSAANTEIAKKGEIASASSEQYTRNTLRMMFGKKEASDSARIFPVPKDMDALLAVGYGVAKSALVTEHALDQLKNSNPKLHMEMKTLAEGRESLLLIVAMPELFVKDAEEIIRILKNMSANQDGREKLKMLGLDRWKSPDSSDRSKLGELNE